MNKREKIPIAQFYQSCVQVRGFLRSVICDFQNYEYHFVTNDITSKGAWENRDSLLQEEHISKLINRELPAIDKNCFPTVPTDTFEYPSIVSNIIIELNPTHSFDIILEKLGQLFCYNAQLILKEVSEESAHFLLECLKKINASPIKYLELVIPFPIFKFLEKELNYGVFVEIAYLFVYAAPKRDIKVLKTAGITIFFDNNKNYTLNKIVKKSIKLFQINIVMYCESLSYNTYYNRKIFIDRIGNMYSNAFSGKSIGNIYDTAINLQSVVKSKRDTYLWYIKKDKINVCNVCEFRHMCLDNRIPLKHKEGELYYHNSECNYNPFIAKWSDEPGYLSLRESGIEIKSRNMFIDYKRLNEMIEQIYSI